MARTLREGVEAGGAERLAQPKHRRYTGVQLRGKSNEYIEDNQSWKLSWGAAQKLLHGDTMDESTLKATYSHLMLCGENLPEYLKDLEILIPTELPIALGTVCVGLGWLPEAEKAYQEATNQGTDLRIEEDGEEEEDEDDRWMTIPTHGKKRLRGITPRWELTPGTHFM